MLARPSHASPNFPGLKILGKNYVGYEPKSRREGKLSLACGVKTAGCVILSNLRCIVAIVLAAICRDEIFYILESVPI